MSCTANALPGADMTWKKGSTVLSTGGMYEVGSATYSNDSTNFKVAMTLKITATTSTVVTSFQNCLLVSPSQGLAECRQSYECSAVNGGVSSSAKSSTIEVKVNGLQGKNRVDFNFFENCFFSGFSCSFSYMAFIKY